MKNLSIALAFIFIQACVSSNKNLRTEEVSATKDTTRAPASEEQCLSSLKSSGIFGNIDQVERSVSTYLKAIPAEITKTIGNLQSGRLLRSAAPPPPSAFPESDCDENGKTNMARNILRTLSKNTGYWVRGLTNVKVCKQIHLAMSKINDSCDQFLNEEFGGAEGLAKRITDEIEKLPSAN